LDITSNENNSDDLLENDKKTKKKPQKARSTQRSSIYRGVSRCSKDGRWQARIRVGTGVRYLGRFPTEEEAARCYDNAAREHHGSKAILNFVHQSDIVL